VGHDVIDAGSFDDAKRLLAARRPALIISSLRLAAFNGLHLVHLGRLAQPDLGAIILSAGADEVLRAEAERVGASLLVEPVPTATLLSHIAQMIETGSERRQSDRRRVSLSGFAPDRRLGERRAAVFAALPARGQLRVV
jgi:DNA-binding NtrC family response regulator